MYSTSPPCFLFFLFSPCVVFCRPLPGGKESAILAHRAAFSGFGEIYRLLTKLFEKKNAARCTYFL